MSLVMGFQSLFFQLEVRLLFDCLYTLQYTVDILDSIIQNILGIKLFCDVITIKLQVEM